MMTLELGSIYLQLYIVLVHTTTIHYLLLLIKQKCSVIINEIIVDCTKQIKLKVISSLIF